MFLVRIKDFEKDQAILQDHDGCLYIWPKKLLAENAQIGETLEIEIKSADAKKVNTIEKPNQAKEILNEILKIQDK